MATTLQNIIDLTRYRSNMENNFFVTDAELTIYINNSLAELDDILVTDYEDYRVSSFQSVIPTDGTSNTIPIPSNLYKLRGVDYQINHEQNGTYWLTLFPFQMPERNRQRNGLTNILIPYRTGLSYRLEDTQIMIMPQMQAGGTYQVWFTPKFVPLVETTDTLNIQMDTQAWGEYAVVDCCAKIFNKQALDPSGFLAEKAALQQRVRGAMKNRDAAAPKRVSNVRFQDNDFGAPFGWDNF
ncbi:MAG: hypothetical protein ABSB40_11995 [Nitrososphaeria archaeon]|jgi:hypothetical protein